VDSNYTVKKCGDRYYIFITVNRNYSYPLHGSYDTPEAAEAAYARWQADDDKREHQSTAIGAQS
jgi:hypothetical protein